MAVLEVLHFPDERLRTLAQPVGSVTPEIKQLVKDMFDTMYAAPGIGLAATQVNVHKQIIVMDLSEDRSNPLCFINPEILESSGSASGEEGCLSVPGAYDNVERAERIKVRALDGNGEGFELEAEGLLAVCIQHEMDHLQGKLFIDYLSALKRQRLKKKMQKQQRQRD